jgi:hypothetical protein
MLAALLDLLVVASAADAVGLALTLIVWRYAPAARAALPWAWGVLAAAALVAFLLRDAGGGRARQWLAMRAELPGGAPPGAWGSIRRNLPLLVPFWNVYDAWPLTRDGEAPRRCDRSSGVRISSSE